MKSIRIKRTGKQPGHQLRRKIFRILQIPVMFHNNAYNEYENNLMLEVASGNRKAYAELYSSYMPRLYHYLFPLLNESKQDTEEIIQEVFLCIWEKRASLVAVQSFQAYVFRIARNKLVDQHRSRKARIRLAGRAQTATAPQVVLPEEDILYIHYNKIAREAINRLSPKKQEIFRLSTQEDLSMPEIAAQLGISRSVVKKQLYAARQFVKNYLRHNAEWMVATALSLFCLSEICRLFL